MTITLPSIPFEWEVFWHCMAGLMIVVSIITFICQVDRWDDGTKKGIKYTNFLFDFFAIICFSIGQGF